MTNADIVSPPVNPAKSRMMAAVRTKHTKPEMIVRRLAHAMGYRYRLHDRTLPGTPDLVFSKKKVVIQVCGCFWHQHEGCSKVTLPKTRQDFWAKKLASNVARDRNNLEKLTKMGWRIVTIWECQVADSDQLEETLQSALGHPRSREG